MTEPTINAGELSLIRMKAAADYLDGKGLPMEWSSNDIRTLVAEVERLRARAARYEAALRLVEPYIDSIVCYASTMNEHEGNRVAFEVCNALAPIEPEEKQ
jgi:hypothetical protein